MIDYIDSNHGDGKPFFAYVAHQAPHDPYHLPRKARNGHVAQYDKGWDAVRRERLDRQIELGIMPADTQLSERMWFVPDPTMLAPTPRADLVVNLDMHIGRLVDHLKEIGEYDNTIFIVFGDNGAEGTDLFAMIAGTPGTRDWLWAAINWSQTDPQAWGDPGSFVGYGPMWAQVSMTPFSQYKGWMAEGGIRNALIVSGPVVKRDAGSINHGFMHVADIMPTLLDVAGTKYPDSSDGRPLPAMMGKSWSGVLSGEAESPRNDDDYMGWELFGNRAIRQGDWKLRWQLRPFGTADWELFNLANDPAERFDLAADSPDKLEQMLGLWEDYVATNNVILPSRVLFETMEKQMPQRVPDDPGYPPLTYTKQFVPPKDMMAPPKQ
jgi:arylsulfatase